MYSKGVLACCEGSTRPKEPSGPEGLQASSQTSPMLGQATTGRFREVVSKAFQWTCLDDDVVLPTSERLKMLTFGATKMWVKNGQNMSKPSTPEFRGCFPTLETWDNGMVFRHWSPVFSTGLPIWSPQDRPYQRASSVGLIGQFVQSQALKPMSNPNLPLPKHNDIENRFLTQRFWFARFKASALNFV